MSIAPACSYFWQGTGQSPRRSARTKEACAPRGCFKAWILGPNRMLGPDIGGHGTGGFIAVIETFHAGACVDAEVGMNVDDARRHPLAVRIDDGVIADVGPDPKR